MPIVGHYGQVKVLLIITRTYVIRIEPAASHRTVSYLFIYII